MSARRIVAKAGAATLGIGLAMVWAAATASAHVTVHGDDATQGGYTKLTFRVPTESDTASTTALKVQLPLDHPIASVSVQPHAGWSFKVVTHQLSTPITNDDGQITAAVSEIDWSADSATTAIKPGEFDEFNVSAGPLPKVSSISFKAIQTYSDGSVVSWIEQAAPGSTVEPDHPAPTLRLAAASSAAPSASARAQSSGGSDGKANTAIVLGAVGAALGVVALALVYTRTRARPTS